VSALLELRNVEVTYQDVILVLRGVSLEVPEGAIVCLLGANGAGKSTTMKAISGLLASELGRVSHGEVHFAGRRIDRLTPQERVHLGIAHVIEGRRVLEQLTVEENLRAGGLGTKRGPDARRRLDRVYEYFPRLKELRRAVSGYCSGGEQQMLVIGRAIMSAPRLLLLDEPSLGLSPLLTAEVFRLVQAVTRTEKLSVLLVEQNALAALEIADHGYVMENGRVVLDGPAAELVVNQDIKEFFLGVSGVGGRRSYREVKFYRRRKRWLG
jgi:branched-chain amino acid transport system ATP-binding protein